MKAFASVLPNFSTLQRIIVGVIVWTRISDKCYEAEINTHNKLYYSEYSFLSFITKRFSPPEITLKSSFSSSRCRNFLSSKRKQDLEAFFPSSNSRVTSFFARTTAPSKRLSKKVAKDFTLSPSKLRSSETSITTVDNLC